MKFQVFWTGENVVKTKQLFDDVLTLSYRDDTTHADPSDWRSLHWVECVTDDFEHGWALVHKVTDRLSELGVHLVQVSIDGTPVRRFMSALWHHNRELHKVVQETVRKLKRTRSASPNPQLGKIRRKLEETLTLYL